MLLLCVHVSEGPLDERLPAPPRSSTRELLQAFERLIRLYQTERHQGETATAFFMRVAVARVKEVLVDLERLTPKMRCRRISWI